MRRSSIKPPRSDICLILVRQCRFGYAFFWSSPRTFQGIRRLRRQIQNCSDCRTAAIALVVLILAMSASVGLVHGQEHRDVKQIVILYTHRTLTPINGDWDRGIRSSLAAAFDEPLDIEIEYLNLVRHKDPDYLRSWIELLKTKYAKKPPDLVIPVFVPALEFTLKHREAIFPETPIVFCSAPLPLAERAHALPDVTGVAFRLDVAGTISAIRRLHPSHDRLLILSGSSESEHAFQHSVKESILALKTGLAIEVVAGIPRRELLRVVESTPENTTILLLHYDEDNEGNHYSTVEILDEISPRSCAPIYGLYDTLLGHGSVGGSLASPELQGRLAGEQAVRVLKGERPADIPIVGLDTVKLQFDSHQLGRWHISESNLPPESVVAFRAPTLWEQFGRYILLGAAALLFQTAIIVALLMNRSRRFTAEREARNLAGKILTAQEDERRYLAREMHDDLTQRLAASAIAAGSLEQKLQASEESREAIASLKGGLIAICDDMHRLSRQLHPAILDDFGLAATLHSECDRLAERCGISVEFRCGSLPANLPGNISICLYRIAQEAFWNTAKYSHTDRVVVELNSDPEFIHLNIRDFGIGIQSHQISDRQGLGMSSMRERARLVQGTISINSRPGEGVTIDVGVPLPEDMA